MGKLLIIIIAGLIIVGGIWFVRNQRPAQDVIPDRNEETVSPEDDEDVISYTDAGYTPETLTIKAGTKVSFVNESSHLMWTASDPHPVHTDLPALNHRRGVSNGETYSFIFEDAGTYNYHNHLNPTKTGKIVVIP